MQKPAFRVSERIFSRNIHAELDGLSHGICNRLSLCQGRFSNLGLAMYFRGAGYLWNAAALVATLVSIALTFSAQAAATLMVLWIMMQ